METDHAAREISEASRILARHGILDAYGHVSRRHPSDPTSFLMSRSLAPSLVRPGDIVALDFDGNPRANADARLFLERFLHAEIYRARPDVTAVVHSHAPSVLPFTVVKTRRLEAVCHLCGFLTGSPEVYDLADHFGPATNLLITDSSKGRSLADHLGGANVVLMRGHGFTAVGCGVPEATFRAFYTSRNCEIEFQARQLGDVMPLSKEEAIACEAAVSGQIDRAWTLWVGELGFS